MLSYKVFCSEFQFQLHYQDVTLPFIYHAYRHPCMGLSTVRSIVTEDRCTVIKKQNKSHITYRMSETSMFLDWRLILFLFGI